MTGNGVWLVRGGYGIFYDSGHADRELRALLQSAVLRRCSCSSRARSRSRWRTRSRPGAAFSPRAGDQHARSGDPDRATRSRAALGLEGVVAGTTIAVALRRRRTATTWCASATSTRRCPAPARSTRAGRSPTLGDVLLVESTASSSYHALELSAVRRAAAQRCRSAPPTRWRTRWTTRRRSSRPTATTTRRRTAAISRPSGARRTSTCGSGSSLTGAVGRTAQLRAGASRATGRRAPCSPRSRAVRSRRASASTTATPATSAAAPSPTIGRTSSSRHAAGRRPVVRTYDGQTFVIAPQYTFGNAGRNSLVGPGYAALDAMVSRQRAARRPPHADAAAGDLQRAEPEEPPAARQLRRSRDVRPVARGVPPRQIQFAARFTF